MEIIVRTPAEQEAVEMKSNPLWACEVSEFDQHYYKYECLFSIRRKRN